MIASLGYKSYINSFTKVTLNSSSNLDHIFLKSKMDDKTESAVFHVGLSDHSLSALNLFVTHIEGQLNRNRDNNRVAKLNFDKLVQSVKAVNWVFLLNQNNVSQATQTFIEKITNYIADSTVLRKRTNKQFKYIDKP